MNNGWVHQVTPVRLGFTYDARSASMIVSATCAIDEVSPTASAGGRHVTPFRLLRSNLRLPRANHQKTSG